MIRPEKQEAIQKKMLELGIYEEDLVEKFIIGQGRGGQNLQKTANCVFLQHLPSKIAVKCHQSRSRELNRYRARELLCEKYEAQILKIKTEKQQEIEKIRRQKRRRSKKAQEKMLEQKRQRSEIKHLRKPPDENHNG